MMRPRDFAIVVACVAATSCAQAGDRARDLTSLVREDCGSCHGMTLKGGLGAALTPQDLADKDVLSLAAIILDGVPGTPMPPWAPELSAADAQWLVARLKEGPP